MLADSAHLDFTIKGMAKGEDGHQAYLLLNDGIIRAVREQLLFETLEPPGFQDILGYDCRNVNSDFLEYEDEDEDQEGQESDEEPEEEGEDEGGEEDE